MSRFNSLLRTAADVSRWAVGFPGVIGSLRQLDRKLDVVMRSLAAHPTNVADNGIVDRETVEWAYRILLGREAENERVVHEKLGARSRTDLVKSMISGVEFRLRLGELGMHDLFDQPTFVMTELEDGLRFWVNLKDRYVSRGILNGMWEAVETAFVRQVVRPGMRALDIGANLGWFTVHMAKLVGDVGSVDAFEPRNDIYAYLVRTVEANGLLNVTAHNFALGAQESELLLRWAASDENPGGTALFRGDPANLSGTSFQRTPIRRLDDVVKHKVDFIKIDVEGAEKLVFDGADRILSHDRPIILSEMAPAMLADISSTSIADYFLYLRKRGYGIHEPWDGGRSLKRIEEWPYAKSAEIISVILVPEESNLAL